MAGTTGLEPATSAVTGQRSNQLSYVPYSPVLVSSDLLGIFCSLHESMPVTVVYQNGWWIDRVVVSRLGANPRPELTTFRWRRQAIRLADAVVAELWRSMLA